MASLHHPHQSLADQELLRRLIETPLTAGASQPWAAPPRLTQARARGSAGTRVEDMMLRGAQVLGAGALILCSAWLLNGPLYDAFSRPDELPPRPVGADQIATQSRVDTVGPSATPRLVVPTSPPPAQEAAAPEAPPVHQFIASLGHDVIAPQLANIPITADGGEAAAMPDVIAVPFSREASEPPEWLQMPSLGIDTPVIEVYFQEDDWGAIDYAAGYLHGSGDPGEPGNVVVAGHAGVRGAVFMSLPATQVGADIYLDTATYRYHYKVREIKVVWAHEVEVLHPQAGATLMLVTCVNWDTQRLIVVADMVGGARHTL